MADTFIMRGEWIDKVQRYDPEIRAQIIYDLNCYATGREMLFQDNPIVAGIVDFVKGSIDASNSKYAQKVEMSKTAGRKKVINDQTVYTLAREGKTAAEIAKELNVSKSAIDKNDGWRNRKNEEFIF